jgi:hypothetical protein
MAAASPGCRPVPNSRCRPEQTTLDQVVQQHLETYPALAGEDDWDGQPVPAARENGRQVPAYGSRESRRYLECGSLASGFARARCPDCGHDFPVAFSCKGRGLCPSCNAQRMAETAAHRVDLPQRVPPPLISLQSAAPAISSQTPPKRGPTPRSGLRRSRLSPKKSSWRPSRAVSGPRASTHSGRFGGYAGAGSGAGGCNWRPLRYFTSARESSRYQRCRGLNCSAVRRRVPKKAAISRQVASTRAASA